MEQMLRLIAQLLHQLLFQFICKGIVTTRNQRIRGPGNHPLLDVFRHGGNDILVPPDLGFHLGNPVRNADQGLKSQQLTGKGCCCRDSAGSLCIFQRQRHKQHLCALKPFGQIIQHFFHRGALLDFSGCLHDRIPVHTGIILRIHYMNLQLFRIRHLGVKRIPCHDGIAVCGRALGRNGHIN